MLAFLIDSTLKISARPACKEFLEVKGIQMSIIDLYKFS